MAGMDQTMAKIIRPVDYRSSAGTMARGNNVYNGATNNATSGPLKPKKTPASGVPAMVMNPEALLAYMKRRKANGQ